ncbi:MAG: helix-turn-helix domain-containing protein [Clostridia bacterium]|nr:helix-turn-helix domain-containing protein [Clostridia bacterium]
MKPMCYPSEPKRYTSWDAVPLVLTLTECCRLLGKTEPTIRRWLEQGVLPGTKIGGAWMIRREAVENLLK